MGPMTFVTAGISTTATEFYHPRHAELQESQDSASIYHGSLEHEREWAIEDAREIHVYPNGSISWKAPLMRSFTNGVVKDLPATIRIPHVRKFRELWANGHCTGTIQNWRLQEAIMFFGNVKVVVHLTNAMALPRATVLARKAREHCL